MRKERTQHLTEIRSIAHRENTGPPVSIRKLQVAWVSVLGERLREKFSKVIVPLGIQETICSRSYQDYYQKKEQPRAMAFGLCAILQMEACQAGPCCGQLEGWVEIATFQNSNKDICKLVILSSSRLGLPLALERRGVRLGYLHSCFLEQSCACLTCGFL